MISPLSAVQPFAWVGRARQHKCFTPLNRPGLSMENNVITTRAIFND